MSNEQKAKAAGIVALLFWLAVICAALAYASRVGAQSPSWASYRAVAQAPITCTMSRAPKDDAGHVVGRYENIGTIPAQSPDRVLDVVLDPGYQYVMDCHFTIVDPVTYEGTAYLPVAVRPRTKR